MPVWCLSGKEDVMLARKLHEATDSLKIMQWVPTHLG